MLLMLLAADPPGGGAPDPLLIEDDTSGQTVLDNLGPVPTEEIKDAE